MKNLKSFTGKKPTARENYITEESRWIIINFTVPSLLGQKFETVLNISFKAFFTMIKSLKGYVVYDIIK